MDSEPDRSGGRGFLQIASGAEGQRVSRASGCGGARLPREQ